MTADRSAVCLRGAALHQHLLTQGRQLIADMANALPDHEAESLLALLYDLVLMEEMISQVSDTAAGAEAMEAALQRVVPYGIVQYALKHGFVYTPGDSPTLN